MRLKTIFVVLFVPIVMLTNAFAEEKKWKDQAELSFVNTGGNTDVTSLSAKNELKYQFSKKLLASWKLQTLFGESDGVKNAENYFTELRADYSFSGKLFLSVNANWLKDKFSGVDPRVTVGPSVGYHFLAGPKHSLVGEAGLLYVNEEHTDNTQVDYLGGRLFAKYEYAFSEKNKFSQSVEALNDFDNSDNTNLISETALVTALTDVLSQKASYVIKYDNEPIPATLDRTDTILSLTLIVNF
ncbi:MAG: YdiY family protein [Nitrospiria bacterium]